MPGTVAPHVEMTWLQGLADLERLEGPWLDYISAGEPKSAATKRRNGDAPDAGSHGGSQ